MPTLSTADLQKLQNQSILGLFKKKNSVFLSTILSGLNWEWDTTIPVAAVNNTTIFVNPDCWENISKDMRITVLAHELWHVALQHLARGKHLIWDTYNMAADHAINLMLKEHGYVFEINHLADPRFTGMSAEQIYKILVSENTPVDLPFGSDIRPDPKKDEHETAIDEAKINSLIMKAYTAAKMNDQAGNLPGGFEESIQKLLYPELQWHELLHKFFVDISNEESSWIRPSRRFQDMYMPGRGGNNRIKKIAWILDISISINQRQIQTFNGAVKDAKMICNPELMVLATFSTEINDVWEFTEDEQFDCLQVSGRGGTDLACVREFLIERGFDAAVIFSDLECDPMDRIPGCDIVWLCFDNPTATVEHGKLVHFTTASDY